ncbi:MAG: sugar ABC transporter permease [Treponema sp.]|nr:sugar ABC transporter permease [Treponema sp.]
MKNSAGTVTPELKNEILATVTEAAEDINTEKYAKAITKIVDKGYKKSLPAAQVIEAAKDELSARQSSFTRNVGIVFNSNDNMGKYFWNTLVMWILGFVPQIFVSLLLAVWFTNTELRLKAQQFFKSVIYMPNLIMAAAFAMLFVSLLAESGPVNSILKSIYNSMNAAEIEAGTMKQMESVRFFTYTGWTRATVAVMNFLMWYGNTTILLMAGVMGIDNSLFEAARIDGASSVRIFFKITIPLLLPIFVYVLITSLIGGIQMFDVPQILTNGNGNPNRTTMTIIMKLNKHLVNKNYGPAGITSMMIFAITGVLSGVVYKMTMKNYQNKR